LSNDDSELERLKAKRLAEMQRNIQNSQTQSQPEPNQNPTKSPRDVVLQRLGFRGLEVLQNAENQFPNEATVKDTRSSATGRLLGTSLLNLDVSVSIVLVPLMYSL
jgi:hypothetical protein